MVPIALRGDIWGKNRSWHGLDREEGLRTFRFAFDGDFTYRIAAFGTNRSFLEIVHSVWRVRGGLHGMFLLKFIVAFRCPKSLKIASTIAPK